MEKVTNVLRDHDTSISRVFGTRVHVLREHQHCTMSGGRRKTDFGALAVVSRCAARVLVSGREKWALRSDAC